MNLLINPPGIVPWNGTLVRFSQQAKVDPPMLLTLSGMVIPISAEHPPNGTFKSIET
jgi:hypothetical protein